MDPNHYYSISNQFSNAQFYSDNFQRINTIDPGQEATKTIDRLEKRGFLNKAPVSEANKFSYTESEIRQLYHEILVERASTIEGEVTLNKRVFAFTKVKDIKIFDITQFRKLKKNKKKFAEISAKKKDQKDQTKLEEQKKKLAAIKAKIFSLKEFRLGEGSYGVVYKIFQVDKARFRALKVVKEKLARKGEEFFKARVMDIIQEGNLLMKLNPQKKIPGIQIPIAVLPGLFGYVSYLYETDLFEKIYQLKSQREKEPLVNPLKGCFQILCGAFYLSAFMNIRHTDYKPENFLVVKDKLHISDMGGDIPADLVFETACKMKSPTAGLALAPEFTNKSDVETIIDMYNRAVNLTEPEEKRAAIQKYQEYFAKMSTFSLAASLYTFLVSYNANTKHDFPYSIDFETQFGDATKLNFKDLRDLDLSDEIVRDFERMLDPDLETRLLPSEAAWQLMEDILELPILTPSIKFELYEMREQIVNLMRDQNSFPPPIPNPDLPHIPKSKSKPFDEGSHKNKNCHGCQII